ncbi:hypothetical protein Cgig2_021755 [Carnegiea gigantea]|uniref:Endonuclease/exonuclease/phosphatase domain-containing protein n=1 Tax=Carnegiea gigantea TaxID=171969 RepID=A0A9Q1JRW9_9CARY|nr:hypothetical protein Cgig2_021755 [Carnegiea gigantea]
MDSYTTMQSWICIIGKFTQKNFGCAIYVVYALNEHAQHLDVWNQLRNLRANYQLPFILLGDFNEVMHPSERRGAASQTPSMRELAGLVQDLQLIDLDINQAYTWIRSNRASKIDHILWIQRSFKGTEFFEHVREGMGIAHGVFAGCQTKSNQDTIGKVE